MSRRRSTSLVELAETHNLALSLARLRNSTWDLRWKRALYHAVSMSCSQADAQKLRIALDLP